MRHSLPIAPQFYVTAPQPCPYLPGRMERKLFTALQNENAEKLNDSLSRQGFRRSQNVLYRPACADCAACLSARIRVSDFAPSKSQRRVLKRNNGLMRSAVSPWATEEQFALFRDYLDTRHADGGMADMDIFEFAAMIEQTPIRSRVIEYHHREEDGSKGTLAATCLTDILEDGLSMVYSFFDPDLARNSLGTFLILDHIEIARSNGLPYVYLGYWVQGSDKMDYKRRFAATEVYMEREWQRLEDIDAKLKRPNPILTDPIAEQVAQIRLPNASPAQQD